MPRRVSHPFFDNIRTAAAMIPREHRRRWLAKIPLSLLAMAVESAAAACVFALVAMLHDGASAMELPILRQIHALLPLAWREEQVLRNGFLVATAVVFTVRIAVTVGTLAFDQRVIARDHAALARTLFEGYMRAPWAFHLDRNVADYLYRINTAAQYVFVTVLGSAASLLNGLLLALSLLFVLFLADPAITMAVTAFLGLWIWGVGRLLRERILAIGRENDRYSRLQQRTMLSGLTALREIKVLGRERWFTRKFADCQEHMVEVGWRAGLVDLLPRLTLESVFLAAILLVTAAMLAATDRAGSLLPIVGLYAYVGLRLLPTVGGVLWSWRSIVGSSEALDHLARDFAYVRGVLENDEAEAPPLVFEKSIRLRGIGFRYEGSVRDVLSDVSLDIPRGSRLGIVGPTGAGKSTLVHLVLGLLEPTAGAVLIDDRPLAAHGRAWRRRVGFVPQTIAILDASLRANVALGVDPREIDDEQVRRCLRLARLDDFVSALPKGLDTPLGDRGVRVSVGEQQRIAIARAVFHRPDVLVFDEATASLDVRTEGEISRAIDELARDATMILIAHRLATVRDCDTIVVLDEGRIVDRGSYDELLGRCPLFQELAAVPRSAQ
jgi:ABC-type multidrug transport system fused ATPase/permease subunit